MCVAKHRRGSFGYFQPDARLSVSFFVLKEGTFPLLGMQTRGLSFLLFDTEMRHARG